MEWIIGMLDIVGQEIILTFHHPVLTGPHTGILGKCVTFALSKGKQPNCVMLPVGNQELASSSPGLIILCLGPSDPCEIIPAVGLDLLISFLYECLILVDDLYQQSASACTM